MIWIELKRYFYHLAATASTSVPGWLRTGDTYRVSPENRIYKLAEIVQAMQLHKPVKKENQFYNLPDFHISVDN